MFNYLINEIADLLERQQKDLLKLQRDVGGTMPEMKKTWIHELFEGQLSSETRCWQCKTVTRRQESFTDLPLEITGNHISITHALNEFTDAELMQDDNKFYCDTCRSLQDADRRMLIQHLPRVLVLSLKRFQYSERTQSYTKLVNRVSFPLALRLRDSLMSPTATQPQ